MLKIKYLHRQAGRQKDEYWTRRYKRDNTIDLFSELPKHESIRSRYRWFNIDTTPLYEFIHSKIGCEWNDVYSEIIKKTKKKYRREIEHSIDYYVVRKPNYDSNFIPRHIKYYRNPKNDMIKDFPFVDINGILVIKTEQEILLDSKKYIRMKKLQEILKNQENEINQSPDL